MYKATRLRRVGIFNYQIFVCKFTAEHASERILKIDKYMTKLMTKTFWDHALCVCSVHCTGWR